MDDWSYPYTIPKRLPYKLTFLVQCMDHCDDGKRKDNKLINHIKAKIDKIKNFNMLLNSIYKK